MYSASIKDFNSVMRYVASVVIVFMLMSSVGCKRTTQSTQTAGNQGGLANGNNGNGGHANQGNPNLGQADLRVFHLFQAEEFEAMIFIFAAQMDELQVRFNKAQQAQDAFAMALCADENRAAGTKLIQTNTHIDNLPWKSMAGKNRADLLKERGVLWQQISVLQKRAAMLLNEGQHVMLAITTNEAASRRLQRIGAIDSFLGAK
jgi:hypothetical protein